MVSHVIVPPSKALDPLVEQCHHAGIGAVIDSATTSVLVVDQRATQGWFSIMSAQSVEPDLLGRQVAVSVYGHVAVAATGVQVA